MVTAKFVAIHIITLINRPPLLFRDSYAVQTVTVYVWQGIIKNKWQLSFFPCYESICPQSELKETNICQALQCLRINYNFHLSTVYTTTSLKKFFALTRKIYGRNEVIAYKWETLAGYKRLRKTTWIPILLVCECFIQLIGYPEWFKLCIVR